MTKDELIDLLQAVKRDVVRDRGQMTELACAIQFAIWHLQGEPSFVERNDRRRAEKNAASGPICSADGCNRREPCGPFCRDNGNFE